MAKTATLAADNLGTYKGTEEIQLSKVQPCPINTRSITTKEADRELADSILQNGQLEPAIVSKTKDGYTLFAGRRRLEALKHNQSRGGPKTIIAAVYEFANDAAGISAMLIENLHRLDLHPLDEAEMLAELIQAQGMTIAQAAQKLGRKPGEIARRAKLCELDKSLSDFLRKSKVVSSFTMSFLERIARLPKESQKAIVKRLENDYGSIDQLQPEGDERENKFHAQEVQRVIAEYMRDLESMKWNLDDAALVPEAGACNTCTKRIMSNKNGDASGYLFDDIEIGGGLCTDAKCFSDKQRAFVQLTIEKSMATAKADKTPIAIVSENYSYNQDDEKQLAKDCGVSKIHRKYEFEKAKKSDKNAVLAINPDTGETSYMKPASKSVEQTVKEDNTEKKPKTLAQKKSVLLERRIGHVCQLARDFYRKIISTKPQTFESVRSLCADITIDSLVMLIAIFGMNHCNSIRSANEWKDFYELKKDKSGRLQALFHIIASTASIFSDRLVFHSLDDAAYCKKELLSQTWVFKLPLREWEAKAAAEIPIPKSWGIDEAALMNNRVLIQD